MNDGINTMDFTKACKSRSRPDSKPKSEMCLQLASHGNFCDKPLEKAGWKRAKYSSNAPINILKSAAAWHAGSCSHGHAARLQGKNVAEELNTHSASREWSP